MYFGLNPKALLFVGGVDDNYVNKYCAKYGLEKGAMTAEEVYDKFIDYYSGGDTAYYSSEIARYKFTITREQAEIFKDIVDYLNNHDIVQHAINHTAKGKKGDIMTKPEMPEMYQRRRSKYNKRKPR